jgi:transglutaminase-like putative cysteine protease
MSWRVRVVHRTDYHYATPVMQSYNEARLTPRTDPRQNVVVDRVETTPSSRGYRYTDYWGTAVAAFDLHAPHTELAVVGSSVVETAEPVTPYRSATWSELRGDKVTDRFVELLEPTTFVPRREEIVAQAHALVKGHDPAAAVIEVAGWVHEQMTYRPGATGVHHSALDAWEDRAGVCQDFAHLTLALLRVAGVPCRYVSGYLHPRADADLREPVLGESHAWIEAWTGGWWGYDPTNAIEVGARHVWVASGRDYADVPPLKGIISGGQFDELTVTVEVTRLA